MSKVGSGCTYTIVHILFYIQLLLLHKLLVPVDIIISYRYLIATIIHSRECIRQIAVEQRFDPSPT